MGQRFGVLFRLSLEWNSVGVVDGGVTHLAEGLAINKSLEKLDLRSNQISHKGAIELAHALKQNDSLKELGMCFMHCRLSDGDAYFE